MSSLRAWSHISILFTLLSVFKYYILLFNVCSPYYVIVLVNTFIYSYFSSFCYYLSAVSIPSIIVSGINFALWKLMLYFIIYSILIPTLIFPPLYQFIFYFNKLHNYQYTSYLVKSVFLRSVKSLQLKCSCISSNVSSLNIYSICIFHIMFHLFIFANSCCGFI